MEGTTDSNPEWLFVIHIETVKMYLDLPATSLLNLFYNFFEIFRCLLDSQVFNAIDLKSHIFVIFCP